MLLEGLRNRPVTVWGNGVEGQAVTVFLENRNCTVTVVEDPEQIPYSGVIVKSPGISLYRNDLKTARQFGAVFTTGTNLFMEAALLQPEYRPLLIGITGTKGKSTTSALVAHLLREQGNRVALCGNIGDPAINYANRLSEYEVVVVEMSSYQCADLQYAFDISVVLNLYPEHIDWHKTHAQYYKDKLNILEHRSPEQVAILNPHDAMTAMYVKNPRNAIYFDSLNTIHVMNGYFYKDKEKLFSTNVVPLRGDHNLSDVCAALTVVEQAGGDLSLCDGLAHHRAELFAVHQIRGAGQSAGQDDGVRVGAGGVLQEHVRGDPDVVRAGDDGAGDAGEHGHDAAAVEDVGGAERFDLLEAFGENYDSLFHGGVPRGVWFRKRSPNNIAFGRAEYNYFFTFALAYSPERG